MAAATTRLRRFWICPWARCEADCFGAVADARPADAAIACGENRRHTMSDNQPNHELPNRELNDELLSAYLDGELSDGGARRGRGPAGDRSGSAAAVASIAVGVASGAGVAAESAGRDLREQILQKIEKEKPADKVSLLPGDTMPRVTAFQTRRSWIWASLVIAAGLMIMVLQPGKQADKDLPAVGRMTAIGGRRNRGSCRPSARSASRRTRRWIQRT